MNHIPLSTFEIIVMARDPARRDTPVFFDDCLSLWFHARCIGENEFAMQEEDMAGFELRPFFDFSPEVASSSSSCNKCRKP